MWTAPEVPGATADGDDELQVEQTLRTLRFLIIALLAGVLSFGAVVAFIGLRDPPGEEDRAMIRTLLGALVALALGELAAYPLVRRFKLAPLRGSTSHLIEELLRVFSELTLLGAAMAEACALFSLVIYWLTGVEAAFVAAAIAAAVVASRLPTRQRWEKFVAGVGASSLR